MNYWTCEKNNYEEESILLNGGDGRILSVIKNNEGIQFMEKCDEYFSETYKKEDAIKLIDELRKWINK